jgi:protein-S-isoprenylcysteine O-methyltransferase Ste14
MARRAHSLLRTADLPPVWLVLHLLLLRAMQGIGPERPLPLPGLLLVLAGLALVIWGAVEIRRARTSVWPGRTPDALVTTGPFRFSRNPIYLGDAIVLLGAVLWQGTAIGLILLPLLVAILTRRFISREEAGLRAAFGARFEAWAGRVRRWV